NPDKTFSDLTDQDLNERVMPYRRGVLAFKNSFVLKNEDIFRFLERTVEYMQGILKINAVEIETNQKSDEARLSALDTIVDRVKAAAAEEETAEEVKTGTSSE